MHSFEWRVRQLSFYSSHYWIRFMPGQGCEGPSDSEHWQRLDVPHDATVSHFGKQALVSLRYLHPKDSWWILRPAFIENHSIIFYLVNVRGWSPPPSGALGRRLQPSFLREVWSALAWKTSWSMAGMISWPRRIACSTSVTYRMSINSSDFYWG